MELSTALLLGLGSAATFAVSNALQHREAGRASDSPSAVALMRQLVVRPLWIAGSVVGVAAFLLHAAALASGSITAVQPLMILGVVLAVPVRAALDGQRPSADEVGAVLLTCCGVATLVVLSTSESPARDAYLPAATAFAALCGAATWLVWLFSRTTGSGPCSAAAAGVVFGFTACVMKLVGENYHRGGWEAVASSWLTWLMVFAGLGGLMLNQWAYQRARISETMPVLNAVDVSVAILGGWMVFGAAPPVTLIHLLSYPLALALIAFGLRRIGSAIESRDALVTAETSDLSRVG